MSLCARGLAVGQHGPMHKASGALVLTAGLLGGDPQVEFQRCNSSVAATMLLPPHLRLLRTCPRELPFLSYRVPGMPRWRAT